MRQPMRKVTRIFVARIPSSVTESAFPSHFEEFGGITDLYMPKVAIDSATPLVDYAGFGPSHVMMSNPVLEPFMDYLGPVRSYSRMYANLDYPDWGYGLDGVRPSRANIRYRPY